MWKPTTRDQSIRSPATRAGEELVLAGGRGEDDAGDGPPRPVGRRWPRPRRRRRPGRAGRGPRRRRTRRRSTVHSATGGRDFGGRAWRRRLRAGRDRRAGRPRSGRPVAGRIPETRGPISTAVTAGDQAGLAARTGRDGWSRAELLAEPLAFGQVDHHGLGQERLARAVGRPTGAAPGSGACGRSDPSSTAGYCVDRSWRVPFSSVSIGRSAWVRRPTRRRGACDRLPPGSPRGSRKGRTGHRHPAQGKAPGGSASRSTGRPWTCRALLEETGPRPDRPGPLSASRLDWSGQRRAPSSIDGDARS